MFLTHILSGYSCPYSPIFCEITQSKKSGAIKKLYFLSISLFRLALQSLQCMPLNTGTKPGGGGGGYSPQILVGMCRGKVKKWQGLRNELPVERENGGLRNELEPFWAWKWGAPERAWAVLSVKMRGSGTAANPRRCRTRWAAAVGGDERVEIKEILKIMVSGTAKSAKKFKMVMLRNGCFGNLWKWYAPERKFMAENGGLVCSTYPICIHMEVPPPPPPGTKHTVLRTRKVPSALFDKTDCFDYENNKCA